MEIVYLAHPLGGDVDANAARARRWLRWLMDTCPQYAFCCPWLPFVDVGYPDDKRGPGAIDPDSMPEYRARCLRDDIAIAARCDGIVLVGDRVSPGMAQERDAVVASGGWVADLTIFKESLMTERAWPKGPHATPIDLGRGWLR